MRIGSISATVLVVRAGLRLVFSLGIWGGLLLGAAGTLAWTRAWTHLGLCTVMFVANFVILLRANPDVLVARMKRPHAGAPFEKVMLPFFVLAMLAIPIVAGLDAVRYAWASLPAWTLWPGIIVHVSGDGFMLWAMIVNPFLEGSVRIQAERGHRVVTSGPYAMVRHPMYVGVIQLLVGVPLFLGSGWAFLPVAVMVLLLVMRAACEDRMLRNELPGYEAYTQKTRYRLIPGVW